MTDFSNYVLLMSVFFLSAYGANAFLLKGSDRSSKICIFKYLIS